MKLNKLIDAVQDILQGEKSADPKRKSALEDLMAKLEKKESKVRRKLKKAETAEERTKLERKLAIVRAQRQKGEKALGTMSS
ncbi:MAG TPA: hypothetical protein VKN76_03980 [Kiloniellaceae bacterium]|nr:hypothetical protein [Kiloniellaceae bacterium]